MCTYCKQHLEPYVYVALKEGRTWGYWSHRPPFGGSMIGIFLLLTFNRYFVPNPTPGAAEAVKMNKLAPWLQWLLTSNSSQIYSSSSDVFPELHRCQQILAEPFHSKCRHVPPCHYVNEKTHFHTPPKPVYSPVCFTEVNGTIMHPVNQARHLKIILEALFTPDISSSN